MNKNLIALAVGATIAAAPIVATQADVKLWGRLQVELVGLDGGDANTQGNFDNQTEMGDASGMSRWGIDASKDLGNGLKAVGRYAFKMNPSNGAAQGTRDQWVGLKGGFGAVILGRQPTPYKMNGGVKWDPYVATFMQARAGGGMSGGAIGHESFVNDVIAYASPKFAGINFQIGYVADENPTASGTGANGSVTAGGTGVWGPVEVIAAYNNFRNRGTEVAEGGDDVKQWKVGARYKGNGLTAAIQYEDVDAVGGIKVNGNKLTSVGAGSILFLNLGYKFGNTLIAGNWGTTDADNDGQDVDYYAIGARYYFAKKVSTYVGFANTKTDTDYSMFGAGLRYDF
ncbi:MAG: porin [Pseudomonadota bacterium]|nr:porin [Pseudomonadota bacterium]